MHVEFGGCPEAGRWRRIVNRTQAIAIVRALLRYGLTVRDIADALRAHPRAIEVLIG